MFTSKAQKFMNAWYAAGDRGVSVYDRLVALTGSIEQHKEVMRVISKGKIKTSSNPKYKHDGQ